MYHVTITVNYPDGTEKELQSSRIQSEWALTDHIADVIRKADTASSFVIVVARHV